MTPNHPTDEDLSALLDGDRRAETHVRACARCRARVGELRAAIQAVAAPVALPATAVREGVIARALDAAPVSRATGGRVVWLDRFRRPALAGGAVAAAVAAVLAFALIPNRDGRDQEVASQARHKQQTTTAPASAADSAIVDQRSGARPASPLAQEAAPPSDSAGGEAYTAGGMAGAAAGAGAATTDLGDVNDGAALRERVGPAVARRRHAGEEASTFAAPDSQRTGEPQPAAAPAAGGTASSPASGPGEPPPPYSGPPPACEREARALGSAADRLVYVATARWQETPAIVLAFVPEPPASGPARVYVMAQADCRLLFSDAYEQ